MLEVFDGGGGGGVCCVCLHITQRTSDEREIEAKPRNNHWHTTHETGCTHWHMKHNAGCTHWHMTLAVLTESRHWLYPLTHDTGCTHWHMTVAVPTDTSHWLYPLTNDTGCTHWHMTLAVTTDTWHWLYSLTHDSGYTHWHMTLAVPTDTWHWLYPGITVVWILGDTNSGCGGLVVFYQMKLAVCPQAGRGEHKDGWQKGMWRVVPDCRARHVCVPSSSPGDPAWSFQRNI